MKTTWLSRGDYVATRTLLVALAVLYPVVVLGPRVVAWLRGRPLEVAGLTSDGPGPVVDRSSGGAVARYSDALVWSVVDPGTGQRLLTLLPGLLGTALVAAGAVVLWRLVATTERGEPFDRRAVGRLQVLGVLVLAFGLVEAVAGPLVALVVLWGEQVGSVAFRVDLAAAFPLLVGLLVLVLAEGFRVGLRLRDDVEGLV